MRTTRLGKVGPTVSALGIGCVGMSPGVYGASRQRNAFLSWQCPMLEPIIPYERVARVHRETIMDKPTDRIGVVRGTSSLEVEEVFRTLVERWRPAFRLAGLIAEPHGLADRACSAGFLRNVKSGERFSIFHDLGPGSTECHLDGTGALTAAGAIQRDVAAGCDLVLLSKFGKLEADGKGLFGAFTAVLDAHVPLLTSVSRSCETQWEKLAGRSYVVLPADRDRIGAWWKAIRDASAGAVAL